METSETDARRSTLGASRSCDGVDLQGALAEARVAQAKAIADNQRTLDALPRFPGSKLVRELDNPEGGEAKDSEFERCAHGAFEVEDYLVLFAEGWGTFRTYSVPPGTSTRSVFDLFNRSLVRASWQPHRDNRSTGAGGIAIYEPMYERDNRCVWFLIGGNTGRLPLGRAFNVATDTRINDPGCF